MVTIQPTSRGKAPQIAEQLSADISSGRYSAGTMLPTDDVLAKTYSVSRMTLRRAVDILSEGGRVVRLANRGVLVAGGVDDVDATSCRGAAATAVLTEAPKSEKSFSGASSAPAIIRAKTTLAMIRAGTMNRAATDMCEGIRAYGEQHGLQTRIYMTEEGHEALFDTLNHVEDLADGVIVYPFNTPEYVVAVQRLIAIRFPFVSTVFMPGLRMNVVNSADCSCAMQAVNHLIDRYHRPVYFLWSSTSTIRERFDGYAQAMRDAGWGDLVASHTFELDVHDDDPCIWGDERSPAVGLPAARRMLDAMELPGSVYAVNDYVAASVYLAAQERGLRIGRDVRVVGTDNLPLASLMTPTLTTIELFVQNGGYEAACLLHKVILGQIATPMRVALPPKLIIRESA